MIRPPKAHIRVFSRTNARSQPDPPTSVKHRVMDIGLAVPNGLVAPVDGRGHRPSRCKRGVGVSDWNRDLLNGVISRIKNRCVVRTRLESAVDRPVRVHGWIPFVRRCLIMQICCRICPVPLGNHDVTLNTLWASRNRWEFSPGDPVGPVGKHLKRSSKAHSTEITIHASTRLT